MEVFSIISPVCALITIVILSIINDSVPQSSPEQIRRRKRFGSSMIGLGVAIEADAVVHGKTNVGSLMALD